MFTKIIINLLLFTIAYAVVSIDRYSSTISPVDYTDKNQVKREIIRESIRQGVPSYLALSIAKQESNLDINAKSSVGAIGLFQLMPDTAKEFNVNPYDVGDNIKGGIAYLKYLSNMYDSEQLVIASYNAGHNAVRRYNGIPPYRETRRYVQRVMILCNEYRLVNNCNIISENT